VSVSVSDAAAGVPAAGRHTKAAPGGTNRGREGSSREAGRDAGGGAGSGTGSDAGTGNGATGPGAGGGGACRRTLSLYGSMYAAASNTSWQWPQRTQPAEMRNWSGTTLNIVAQAGQRVIRLMVRRL
jgi:hypothetical protein